MITYDDKVSTVSNPLPRINKVVDLDMNEIKTEVNAGLVRLGTAESDIVALQNSLGLSSHYNVLAYGLVADGSTDNSAALTALVATAPAGGTLYFPAGTYKFATTVSINKNLNLEGDGTYSFLTMSADSVMINYTGPSEYVRISNIGFYNSKVGTPTSASIGLKADTVHGLQVHNLFISGFYKNIQLSNVWEDSWTRLYCTAYVNTGMERINSGIYTDAGDSAIVNSFFIPAAYNSTYSIFQTNGGGTKITNTKFNYGSGFKAQYHYYYDGAGITVDLNIANCSFENHSVACIRVGRSSGSFSQVTITGCDIGGTSSGSNKGVICANVDILNITGNTFRNTASGTTVAIDLTNVNSVKLDNVYDGWTTNVATAGSNTNIFTNLETGLLTPSNDDIIQRKAGVWTNRTMAELAVDLARTYSSWSPAVTGFSGTPTVIARYSINGKHFTCYVSISGTSNATTFNIPLPSGVTTANFASQRVIAAVTNNGTSSAAGMAEVVANASTINVYRDIVGTAFTTSGQKGAVFIITLEIQ